MRSYIKAFELIIQHKMYWYALLPAVLMLGIYQLGDYLLHRHVNVEIHTYNDIIWYQMHLLAELSIALLFLEFSKYLVVTLLSPLLSYISTRTEFHLTQIDYPFDWKEFIWQIRRGVIIVVRNMLWQYAIFILIFIVCSFFWDEFEDSPLFWLTYLVGFYYYGFSFIDYVNERRRFSVMDSISIMKQYGAMTFSIGMIYSLMILLPVDLSALFDWSTIGTEPLGKISEFLAHSFLWICASFAPIVATVASTVGMVIILEEEKQAKSLEETLNIQQELPPSEDVDTPEIKE